MAAPRRRLDDAAESLRLTCPITHCIFRQPVLLSASGHTFELEAISRFWAASPRMFCRCPITNIRIPPGSGVAVNFTIRQQVLDLLTQYPNEVPYGWEERVLPPQPTKAELQELSALLAQPGREGHTMAPNFRSLISAALCTGLLAVFLGIAHVWSTRAASAAHAAELEVAAQTVSIVGGTPDSLFTEYVGTYEQRTGELVGERYAYIKRADGEKMLWYASDSGHWVAGPKFSLGMAKGLLIVKDAAARPERIRGQWQVTGGIGTEWKAAPDVRCLAGVAGVAAADAEAVERAAKRATSTSQQLALAQPPSVILVGSTPDGLQREYMGTYDRRERELVGERYTYVKRHDEKKMLWFANSASHWVAGLRDEVGQVHGKLWAHDAAVAPEHITAGWEVGKGRGNGFKQAPAVRCIGRDMAESEVSSLRDNQ